MHDPLRSLLLIALCFIFPPLAVVIYGGISGHFWISVILTLLGYMPGVVHALWVLLSGEKLK
jgi:uncharacterized membrane protein YqaE (UPF0057 family)